MAPSDNQPDQLAESATQSAPTRLDRIARLLVIVVILALVGACATGVSLVYLFTPSASAAPGDPTRDLVRGMLLRNLHRRSAEAMVLVVPLAFVLATRRSQPRGRATGAALIVISAALWLSSTLMPWDQLSVWAVTAVTSPPADGQGPFGDLTQPDARYDARKLLTAGREIGSTSVKRFYIVHGVMLPLALAGVIVTGARGLRRRR